MPGTFEEKLRGAMAAISGVGESELPQLEALYDADVRFQDPIQTLEGREAFIEMNRRLLRRSRSLRFEVGEVMEQEDTVFLTWTMFFHPKVGPEMTIEGASHLRVREGRIAYHRDYWDLLSSAAEAMPVMGPLYHKVMQLFA
jgi:ketosteroid isomerase-like protein